MNATIPVQKNLFGEEMSAQIAIKNKIAKMIETRKGNTDSRNQRITDSFNHKYNVERKRYDDVVNELCTEFSLAKSTIEKVIKG